MTQEEIIKLAHTAGFNWPDIQATTIERRLERFASLVAATEREKFTNTQEFVTLPREIVEQALEAIALNWRSDEGEAVIPLLRAALKQPQNHAPDAGNMVPAGWKLVPTEPTQGMIEAGKDAHYEAEKRIQEPDAWKQNGFAKRAVRAAHVFQVMLAAAPQPPTTEESSVVEQPDPAYLLRDLAADIGVKALDLIAAIRDVGLGSYSINMMLPARVCVAMCQKFSAAPQPQVEQEPVAVVDFTTEGWREIVDALRTLPDGAQLYTRPQPKREPLTDDQISRLWSDAHNDTTDRMAFQVLARAIEASHNIK